MNGVPAKRLVVLALALGLTDNAKRRASALALQRVLGVGSYVTAWTWLHKFRRAMVRPGRDRLVGRVEVDETYVGGVDEGVPGRAMVGQALTALETNNLA